MTNRISVNLSRALDQNNISGYLKQIRKYPLLSHEEEEKLANKWIKSNCFEAAHKLINSHLRLVVKISMKFRGYGLPLNELISEGNIGLIQSLNRFDPSKGFRLSTYDVVDKSINPRIYITFLVTCKNWNNSSSKKLFFQSGL